MGEGGVRDRRWHSPVAACRRLGERAERVAPGVFEGELRHLRWLAERLVVAERDDLLGVEGASGRLRDFTREFGLMLRNVSERLDKLEAAEAEGGGVVSDADFRLRVVGGG